MFKIAITALLIIVLQLKPGTEGNCQTKAINDNQKYTLEILPLIEDNLSLIKFNLESECYVKIKITDHVTKEEHVLVDDEMQAGEYNVYCKTQQPISNGKNECAIVIYDGKRKIIYSKGLKL